MMASGLIQFSERRPASGARLDPSSLPPSRLSTKSHSRVLYWLRFTEIFQFTAREGSIVGLYMTTMAAIPLDDFIDRLERRRSRKKG